MQRRDVLKNIGIISTASLLSKTNLKAENGPKYTNDKTQNGKHHTFEWINDTSEKRPKYVWENKEDVIYHEIYYPDELIQTAPEFYALMREAWVFNRNMLWHRNANKSIIAYSLPENIQLTGEKSAAQWYSDPKNSISNLKEVTVFEKKSTIRKRDAAVLPAFQFHLAQHSVLIVEVIDASTDWQFVVSRKGRSGPPLLSSGWRKGSGKISFNLAEKIQSLGIQNPYSELHFVIGTWSETADKNEKISFKAYLEYTPAIVSCLTPIKNKGNFPVSFYAPQVKALQIKGLENEVNLTQNGDFFVGEIPEKYANTGFELYASNDSIKPANIFVRKPKGTFSKYNKERNYVEIDGKVTKPLTGSYQGNIFFKDAGTSSESIINSQNDWDNWDRTEFPGEHQHAWESLSLTELKSRFSFVKSNGWDLIHLHTHYGIWERFDAVGNLCPYGIEQFNNYVRIAETCGLKVMITLSSYPYGAYSKTWDGGTTPYKQYLEAGFKDEDWYNTENQPFNKIYAQYLTDFASLYADETAIFSISSSGEGDWKGGFKRNDFTFDIIKSIDKNHITVSEPVMAPDKLLPAQVKDFKTDLVGDRNYGFGTKMLIDLEMGLLFRLNQMVPNMYLAESNYPSSNNYCHMVHSNTTGQYNSIIGTQIYRILMRDTLYMGMVRQQPMLMSWDEYFTEDEHIILNKVRSKLDWTLKVKNPSVVVLINDFLATWDGREKMARLEESLVSLGIEYQFISDKKEKMPNQYLIDATDKNYDLSKFKSFNTIPSSIKEKLPFKFSENYAAQYAEWEGETQFLAYFYNRSNYKFQECYIHPNKHRIAKQILFELNFLNMNKSYKYQLYDLQTKQIIETNTIEGKSKISIPSTNSDFLLFATKS
ncbi:MAG: hypothetical protein SFY32_06415 [Bacteroidota bacterium]|nr:hypothetical protein [Bacteroidota bacterium]